MCVLRRYVSMHAFKRRQSRLDLKWNKKTACVRMKSAIGQKCLQSQAQHRDEGCEF